MTPEERGLDVALATEIRAAIAEEREACAKVADHHAAEVHVVPAGTLDSAKMIAAAIRARQ